MRNSALPLSTQPGGRNYTPSPRWLTPSSARELSHCATIYLTRRRFNVPNLHNLEKLDILMGELALLTTEGTQQRIDLEALDTLSLVRQVNAEDAMVPRAVAERSEEIATAVDGISERLRRGGRLIYIGAGTAGRIGVIDASECPPTFGTDPDTVIGLIAGGDKAIRYAVENAEDDIEAAPTELATLELSERDIVVGISASGRTPYVVGGLSYARSVGALTIAIAQNRDSAIGAIADIPIEVVVGPEFIAGSTRLKSGTAQKLIVNMLTTLSMIQLGKTYQGVMVDLVATNAKLRARSVRTVLTVTGVTISEAAETLDRVGGSVKQAILVLLTGMGPAEASAELEHADGFLRIAVERARARGGSAQQ